MNSERYNFLALPKYRVLPFPGASKLVRPLRGVFDQRILSPVRCKHLRVQLWSVHCAVKFPGTSSAVEAYPYCRDALTRGFRTLADAHFILVTALPSDSLSVQTL